MASQFERFGYVGEVEISTYRNFFENQVPTGRQLFTDLDAVRKRTGLKKEQIGNKIIWVKEISIGSKFCEILFYMSNPDIPDNDVLHRRSGSQRRMARLADEDPVASSHMVINIDATHDMRRAYPACIENSGYIGRSYHLAHLCYLSASHLSKQVPRPSKGDTKLFQPRVSFIASTANTIGEALQNGGILKGVSWVSERIVDGALGDAAHPVRKRERVDIKVANAPTGGSAESILKKIWNDVRARQPKKVLVEVEDDFGKVKNVAADVHVKDVLSNAFIPQQFFNGFSTPLGMCEGYIRKDLTSKMRDHLR